MNAGGVPNTCKSNGQFFGIGSGERVSNAWVTCPPVGDTRPKGLLIPHGSDRVRGGWAKVQIAGGGACVPSASWLGNGQPRR